MKYKYDLNGCFDGKYTDDFLEKNKNSFIKNNLVSDWLLTELKPSSEFIKPVFNGVEWVEGSSIDELNVIKNNLLINDVINKYTNIHEPNGYNFYQIFKSELINDFYNGIISESQTISIELIMSEAMDKIKNNGDWKTGLYLLKSIESNEIFINNYINKAILYIEDYISLNYED